MIAADTLANLAVGASTCEERLVSPFVLSGLNHSSRTDARVARWAQFGARGEIERLRRSLRWRGIDLEQMRKAMEGASLPPGTKLPEWSERCVLLVQTARTGHCPAASNAATDERAAVMAPFARAAAEALRSAIPVEVRALIAESTLAKLEQSLLLRLARIAGPVLTSEFAAFAYSDSRAGGDPVTRVQRFTGRLLQPRMPQFLTDYPVLARLVTLACDNWQNAALELLHRLGEDRSEILSQFHEGCDPGLLVDIQVGDADVHDRHRQVVVLVFEDEFRVVYKPRSLVLDKAFHGFADWLNERGLRPSLRSPAVLCRDGYGWAEFIAHRRSKDAAELALFYERTGTLACVAYALGASDLHHGNMIAHGGYPVVIDLETFFKAEPRIDALPARDTAARSADLGKEGSVLHSMLLPLTYRVPGGGYADVSALGAEPESEARQSASWLPVHDLSLKEVLREHATAIETGFATAYQWMADHREELLAEDGPLTAFAHCPIRVVLRDTALYFQLLRHSIDPAVLRDGADRMIALERLNHVIAIAETPPSFVRMVTREQAALAGLDVPRFMVMTDETDLRDAGGLVAHHVMERPPLTEARMRIEALSEDDLQRQRMDIRWALSARVAEWTDARREEAASAESVELPDGPTLIAAAERLGTELLEEAEHSGEPPPWRGLLYLCTARRFTVGDAGGSFADGGLGIAVFFSALYRVTGNGRWKKAATDLSLAYLAPVARPGTHRGHIRGGITSGVGGLLYGAALVAALTQSDEVFACGLSVAQQLAQRAVADEKDMSLGEGLAGTLLGLAALRNLADDARLSEVVENGAARFQAGRPLAGSGLLSGRAGVALAANLIGPGSARCCAGFDEPAAGIGMGWAEGAIGIALTALKADPETGWALKFVENLASAPMAADDGFAFGAAGEVDALAWAAYCCEKPELHRLASLRMAGAAERARHGRPRLLGGTLREGLRIPGLLHGTAGLGYVLLRLAEPMRLPALSVFEMPLKDPAA